MLIILKIVVYQHYKTKQMEKTTLIKYEDIEFEVVYALDDWCEGDYQTAPRQADAFSTEVLSDKTNIVELIDADIIEQWETQILEEIL